MGTTRRVRRGGSIGGRFGARAGAAWLVAGLAGSPAALAGGGPENVIIIADPMSPESMYAANYYKNARNLPDANVLFLSPDAANFAAFAAFNAPAVVGELDARDLEAQGDYILVMPGSNFFIAAPGLVTDGCSPVNRFSISGAYSLAFLASEIALGNRRVTERNGYSGRTDEGVAFSSLTGWEAGEPSGDVDAPRYYIGAMLGYTGQRGNTLEEVLALVDRTAASDGTRPLGTFYFMNTTDDARSGPREGLFPAAIQGLQSRGGAGEEIAGVLPDGRQDCLGVMTGWANPEIDSSDFTLLPGSLADHLTSFAGTFDTNSQVKMSRWIAKGASATWGAVEEPCNYPGKFPAPRQYVYYYQGLSAGEATMRSAAFHPFQGLLLGDPLARAMAYLPAVDVPDAPAQPVSGVVRFSPQASTDNPDAGIDSIRVLVNGVPVIDAEPGFSIDLDTRGLPDGWHDFRVLAFDDSRVRSVGRWTGELEVDNLGRSASAQANVTSGDLSTAFVFSIASAGKNEAAETVRLWHSGRVLASAPGDAGELTVYGLNLGAGVVRVTPEAVFADGMVVKGRPIELTIAYQPGVPTGVTPVSHGYARDVKTTGPVLLHLPTTTDDLTGVTWEIVGLPQQSEIVLGSGPYALLTPGERAGGSDAVTFVARSPRGDSLPAVIVINYLSCPGDFNGDDRVNGSDFLSFLSAFFFGSPEADVDGNGAVDGADFLLFLSNFFEPCF